MTKVLQSEFKGALSRVGRSVAGKSTLPVLMNAHMQVVGGRFELAATNLDTYVKTAIGCNVSLDGEWAGTVPHKLLSDVVGSLPNDAIVLSWDARTATLSMTCGGRFVTNIKGIEADEFPTIPTPVGDSVYIPFDGAALAATINRIAPFVADNNSRPALAGVGFRADGHTMSVASADGFRLAREAVTLGEPLTFSRIVPGRGLAELARLIGDSAKVDATFTDALAHFDIDGATTFGTRLIGDTFPDFERIIPAQYTTRAIVDSREFAAAVKLAGYFAAKSQNVIKLSFADGVVTLSANAAEVGDNTGDVTAITAGAEMAIAVNYEYLSEALAVVPTAQIALEAQNDKRPLVIKPVGSDIDWLAVLMPMSLAGR